MGTSESEKRYPQVKIREWEDEYMKFDLYGTDVSIANALRRVMIAEVPTLAIELVDIESNSSCLADEMLAHRLGLLPLVSHSAMKMIMSRDCHNCDGDGPCDFCSVEFQLNVKCTGEQTMEVTTNDLILTSTGIGVSDVEPVSRTKPGSPPITLAKLSKGQQLKIRCLARKGIGKDHAKFSAACTVTFFAMPHIHINYDLAQKLTLQQKKDFIKSSPTNAFQLDPDTQQIEVINPELYNSYDEEVLRQAEMMDVPGLVTVIPSDDHFIFTVETTGVIKSHELFLNAIQVLRLKLDSVRPTLDDNEESIDYDNHM